MYALLLQNPDQLIPLDGDVLDVIQLDFLRSRDLPIRTRSPTFTGGSISTPEYSEMNPAEIATTSHSVGFSFTVSGNASPDLVVAAPSMRRSRTISQRRKAVSHYSSPSWVMVEQVVSECTPGRRLYPVAAGNLYRIASGTSR